VSGGNALSSRIAVWKFQSTELDEVECRQRAAGELDEPAADGARAEIDAEETKAFDQGGEIGLGGSVITRIEQQTVGGLVQQSTCEADR